MRLIGHLHDESSARVFGDFLLVQGIENTVENDHSWGWAIWISDEDKIDSARTMLDQFRASPGDNRFKSEAKTASNMRAEKEREQARWEKKVKGRREMFRPMVAAGFGPLTLALIVASSVIYILTQVNPDGNAWTKWLMITVENSTLPEIRHGQVWRLLTPIFLHYGILHILFNMLWLRDLGGVIEARQGTAYLGWLVLGIGIGSNLAQFYIGRSPYFGGMSGVVYGLLGYIWIRGRMDPSFGIYLQPITVLFMLIWFAAGFAGVIGGIANWAHAGGLVLGMAWGYVSANSRN